MDCERFNTNLINPIAMQEAIDMATVDSTREYYLAEDKHDGMRYVVSIASAAFVSKCIPQCTEELIEREHTVCFKTRTLFTVSQTTVRGVFMIVRMEHGG